MGGGARFMRLTLAATRQAVRWRCKLRVLVVEGLFSAFGGHVRGGFEG